MSALDAVVLEDVAGDMCSEVRQRNLHGAVAGGPVPHDAVPRLSVRGPPNVGLSEKLWSVSETSEKVGNGHSIGECVIHAALVDAIIIENKETDVGTLPGQEHAEPARRLGDVRLSGRV